MKLRILAVMFLLFVGAGLSLISCSGKNPISPSAPSNAPTPTTGPTSYFNSGTVSTFAGNNSFGNVNGSAISVAGSGVSGAEFGYPYGVAVDKSGNVFVADEDYGTIRKISNGQVTTVATGFSDPEGLAIDNAGNLYIADESKQQIFEVSTNNVKTILAGSGSSGYQDGPAATAEFYDPWGIAVDNSGNVYVSDEYNYVIRKISNGVVSTIAGEKGNDGYQDGPALQAQFYDNAGMAIDNSGNLYVADEENYAIRKISTSTGMVSTLASMYYPYSVAVDPLGNVYAGNEYQVFEYSNGGSKLLAGKYDYPGLVNGQGTNAEFDEVYGLAVDGNGVVYVGDEDNYVIRQIK